MKRLILIILLFLPACGYYGDDPESYSLYDKIYDWQDRELVDCIQDSSIVESEQEPSLEKASTSLSWIYQCVLYIPDKGIDYWQTSCETLEIEKGDCDDQAILLWRLLRKQGFSDEINRLGWLKNKNNEEQGHLIVILHYENKIFALDPIRYDGRFCTLDLYLQRFPYYYLIFEFNFDEIWAY